MLGQGQKSSQTEAWSHSVVLNGLGCQFHWLPVYFQAATSILEWKVSSVQQTTLCLPAFLKNGLCPQSRGSQSTSSYGGQQTKIWVSSLLRRCMMASKTFQSLKF